MLSSALFMLAQDLYMDVPEDGAWPMSRRGRAQNKKPSKNNDVDLKILNNTLTYKQPAEPAEPAAELLLVLSYHPEHEEPVASVPVSS